MLINEGHMMLFIFSFLFVFHSNSFALTPDEQERLIEENKFLRDQALKRKSEVDDAQSKKMMEVLQKGKKHQEEQIEFLNELDNEE
jgi:hypothetical protein